MAHFSPAPVCGFLPCLTLNIFQANFFVFSRNKFGEIFSNINYGISTVYRYTIFRGDSSIKISIEILLNC
jgi:hypothetical protein